MISCHVVRVRLNRQFMTMAAPVKKRDVPRNFEDRNSDDNDQSSSNNEDNEKEVLDEEVRNLG